MGSRGGLPEDGPLDDNPAQDDEQDDSGSQDQALCVPGLQDGLSIDVDDGWRRCGGGRSLQDSGFDRQAESSQNDEQQQAADDENESGVFRK